MMHKKVEEIPQYGGGERNRYCQMMARAWSRWDEPQKIMLQDARSEQRNISEIIHGPIIHICGSTIFLRKVP